jgi:hypothetical protein
MKGTRFDLNIYENLPPMIKDLLDEIEDGPQKDAILLSIITSLGATFYSVSGRYAKENLHPNLMTFIIGPPSAGKGNAKLGPELVSGIKRKAEDVFNVHWEQHNNSENILSKEPELLLNDLMLPGNSSYAAIIDHLYANNEIGFIFETEADTISKIIKMEWGDFSDFLRKAYHHEPVSARRKGRDPITINKPKVSILLTGTSNQIEPMINSIENGLFSRFCFYYFESEPIWINPNPRFHDLAFGKTEKLKEMINELWLETIKQNPCFTLEEFQWDYLSKVFEDLTKQFVILEKNGEFHAILRRLCSMAFRIAMILETSEYLNRKGEINSTIVCSSKNLETAIKITQSLLQNSQEVAEYLSKSAPRFRIKKPVKHSLLDNLPNVLFKRYTAIEIGKELQISERTTDEYLKEFVMENKLIQPKTGCYQRTPPDN